MADRDLTVDVLRGLGIIVVVSGHAWSGTGLTPFSPYSFHMPLFLFLSGLFFREARVEPPVQFVIRNACALLLPTTVFFLVYAIVCQVLRVIGFTKLYQPFSLSKILFDQFAGSAGYGFTATFWFVTCLFFVRVYFGLVHAPLDRLIMAASRRRAVSQLGWFVLYLVLALAAIHITRKDYPNATVTAAIIIPRTMFAAFFYYLGSLLSQWKRADVLSNVFVLFVLYMLQQQIWSSGITLDFWMQVMKFEHPFLPVVTGLTGIAFFYGIATLISAAASASRASAPSVRVLAYIGAHGMPILLHQLFALFLVNALLCAIGVIKAGDIRDPYFEWHTEQMWFVYLLAGIVIPIAIDRYLVRPAVRTVRRLGVTSHGVVDSG